MNADNIVTIIIFILFIVIIIISSLILATKKVCRQNYSERFRKCICSGNQGGRERNCQDTVAVNNLYVTNKLTENSQLPNKDWSTTSPGDNRFPLSQGCNWLNSNSAQRPWQSWDFTDFGN